MSNNEWVQEGTPREADWSEEQDDYGVPVEPAQWDDYAAEQSVPVPTPAAAATDSQEPKVQPVIVDQDALSALEKSAEAEQPTTLAAQEPEQVIASAGDDALPEPAVPAEEVPEQEPAADPAPELAEAKVSLDEPTPVDATVADPDAVVFPTPEAAAETGSADWVQPEQAADVSAVEPATESVEPTEVEPREPVLDEPAVSPLAEEVAPEEPASPVAEPVPAVVPEFDPEPVAPSAEPLAAEAVERPRPIAEEDTPTAQIDLSAVPNETAVSEEVPVTTPEVVAEPPSELVEEPVVDEALQATAVAGIAVQAEEPTAEAPALVIDETPTGESAAAAAALAGLYRNPNNEETQIIDTATKRSLEEEEERERQLAAQLQAEREAREQRLGIVATSEANAIRDPKPVRRRGVGGFGSFGLLILRFITAGIIGVTAYQILGDIDAATNVISQTLLPEPRLVAWILGFGLAAMTVCLVLGIAVRVVGFLLTAAAVAALVFVRWGNFAIFVPGMEGFIGDKDLLLAAVGIAFFSLGGGKVGIDGAISGARARAREAKRA